jgi:DNA mismatch endonuclease (patch repair protein)
MADVHDKKTRSYNMSRIRGTNTKPEMIVRKYLHAKGLRYRLHNKNLPGKPDITLSKYRSVVFINGCFWHGHEGCKYFTLPKTRTEWWKTKIEDTVKRDIRTIKDLKDLGWNPIVIWECELKPKKKEETLNNLINNIAKTNRFN